MNQVKNEEVQSELVLQGWWSKVVYVEVVWTYGEDRGGPISEDDNGILKGV